MAGIKDTRASFGRMILYHVFANFIVRKECLFLKGVIHTTIWVRREKLDWGVTLLLSCKFESPNNE
uniref:Uncharacterized protein n=1 Tax=Cucumis melo TaxID=3656 RepID=A0A9I9EDV2_CUCME